MRKIFLLAVILILFFISFRRTKKGSDYNKKIFVNDKLLMVEIADTPKKTEQGLSERKSLCADCGMLFIFDHPGIYPFWMRRMHFDIDILWIVGDEVVNITFGAKRPNPENFESPKEIYRSKVPMDKVLEVNAGWSKKNGIKTGDRLENIP